MAFSSNGQIQYLVLDSLSHGSKYGLEIIEFISQKTGGNYIMKKPTLYSCLTRMEKKGLVSSSYWGDSEFGGKRHYYSITDSGKKTLAELAPEFENMVYEAEENTKPSTPAFSQTIENTKTEDSKPIFLQQDNLFDMVNKSNQPVAAETKESEKESDAIENQIDIFSYQAELPTQPSTDEVEEKKIEETNQDNFEKIQYYQTILEQTPTKEPEEPVKDDAIFLDKEDHISLTPYQEAQNKKLYDTSNELKKYRNKKSFSENQIEMSVVYEKAEDRQIQKARIEQLKQSMLNAKQNAYETAILPELSTPKTEESFKQDEFVFSEEKIETPKEDPVKDDAIFITQPTIDQKEIPIQRKITPPNIEVNIYDDNLPAPKRNSSLEPTYKDMMAKLFERKKEKPKEPTPQPKEIQTSTTTETFADYSSLKKYYAGHGIEFKEYKKVSVERRHNTNFLIFISSLIMLFLSGVGSAILFGIASGLGVLNINTNFMYYTLPILFLIYAIYAFVKFKIYPSKKPILIYNSIINWIVFVFFVVIVFVINILCNMQVETMANYLSSLTIPILGLLLMFPVNYYTKKILFNKFGK